MASSQDFDAGVAPRDVMAALSLTAGTAYTCQNVSTTATLFARDAATAPAATGRAHRIEAGGYFVIRPDGPFWLWTDDPAGAAVIVTEAA